MTDPIPPDRGATATDAGPVDRVGGPPATGRLAIVADDLTGAADAAAPFAQRGAEVSLVLRWPVPDCVDVLALVADSRWRNEASAAGRVAECVGRARDWGAQRLFVKVDSTLRGNVKAEVGGALAAWAAGPAVAAPAFPAQGRVLKDGVLYVHGEPLEVNVAALFPADVEILDAGTDNELAGIAERILRESAVSVGSSGLARALAAAAEPAPAAVRQPSAPVTGVLVVVGSTHPVSQAQSAALLLSDALCLVVRPPLPVALDAVVVALARGGRVLVTTDGAQDVEGDSAEAQALAAELAGVVRAILLEAPGAALVVTGGATALAVAEVLGARALRLLGEVSPGVAFGELLLGDRRLPTITKSGGFGAEDAILRAVEFLEDCA